MTTTATKLQYSSDRDKLISQLLEAVKQCQIRFGGKKELATEIDKRVNVLCVTWENIFQHGLRYNANSKAISTLKQLTQVTGLNKIKLNAIDDLRNLETEPVFWNFVKEHLSRHELQRYLSLKNVTSDNGRGLAWLRSALNENSLEKYIQTMIGDSEILSQFYEDWALLRDQEKASLLPNMAAGLGSILFAINIDNPSLNVEPLSTPATNLFFIGTPAAPTRRPVPLDDDVVLQPAIVKTVPQIAEGKREKKRKKKPAKIVTFDNEDFSSCSASPASCLVSPQLKTAPVSDAIKSKEKMPDQEMRNLTGKSSVAGAETSTSSAASKGKDSVSEAVVRPNVADRFCFDQSELMSSVVHDFEPEAKTETSFEVQSAVELNGFHSDSSEPKESYSNETIDVNRVLVDLGDLTEAGNQSMISGAAVKNSASLDYVSSSRSVDPNQDKNIEASSVSLKSVANIKGLLSHSDSVTSNTSMASSCSKSSNFMTCDTDVKMSLVPLNAEGKPVDLDDSTVCSLDGDTSESYGSYDSHEMPYGDIVHKATRALGEAERALNTSLTKYANTYNDSIAVANSTNPLSDTLSYEDLKQALIAMMLRKDEAEDLCRRLQVALDAERQSVSSLRKEIEDKHQAELQRHEKNADRNRALLRENELLKNQLKKYIGAVQMLRQGGSVEGIQMDSPQPAIPPPRSSIDYSYEASEYENKLIQVAEMHGELMEFNEMLQRQLIVREAQLRRVTNELVSLRGPLPGDIALQEPEVISSSVRRNHIAVASPAALINIWIPSAFLRGASSDAHHVYQVYIHIRNEEWNVYRRYAEFYELHRKLKKKYPAISYLDFPPKKAFGKKDPKIVEVRRKKLETYLRQVIHHLTEKVSQLADSPSRQVLTSLLPFFSDDAKPEKPKTRTTSRSRDRSGRSSTLHPSSSSEALNHNAEQFEQYMGL